MSDNLNAMIDELGAVKAAMAELAKKEKAIKEALGDLAPGAYEADLFRLTISETVRETLDMDAVREKLSAQFIRAHTNFTDVRTLRVAARNGKRIAA